MTTNHIDATDDHPADSMSSQGNPQTPFSISQKGDVRKLHSKFIKNLPKVGTKDYCTLNLMLKGIDNLKLSFSKDIGVFTRVLLKDIDDMTELNLKTFFNLYEAIEDRQRDLMTILKWNHDEALFDIIHDLKRKEINRNLILHLPDEVYLKLLFHDIKDFNGDQINLMNYLYILMREKYFEFSVLAFDNDFLFPSMADKKMQEIFQTTDLFGKKTETSDKISDQNTNDSFELGHPSDHNDKMAKIESGGVVKNNQTLLHYPVPNDINQKMTEIYDFAPTTQNLMGLKDLKSTKFDLTQKTIFCIDRDQFITKNCLSDKFIYEWPPPRHGKEGTSMISEESRST